MFPSFASEISLSATRDHTTHVRVNLFIRIVVSAGLHHKPNRDHNQSAPARLLLKRNINDISHHFHWPATRGYSSSGFESCLRLLCPYEWARFRVGSGSFPGPHSLC